MKNIQILILVMLPIFVFSQKDSSAIYPNTKTFMFELGFKPFGNEVFSFENIQAKYNINKRLTARLGFIIDNKSNYKSEGDYKDTDLQKPTISEKSFTFGIKPGIEYRILTNSRISPYVGLELNYTKKTSSSSYVDYRTIYNGYGQEYTYKADNIEIKNAWRGEELIEEWEYNYYIPSYTKERAYKALGTKLMLGADFFIIKHLYLGFEFGLGYNYINYSRIEIETTSDYKIDNIPSQNSENVSLYYNNSIRLGIWF